MAIIGILVHKVFSGNICTMAFLGIFIPPGDFRHYQTLAFSGIASSRRFLASPMVISGIYAKSPSKKAFSGVSPIAYVVNDSDLPTN